MIFTETIEYHLNGERQYLPGFDDQYVNIVDYILKITDAIWEQRAVWVIYETYDENIVVYDGATASHGVEGMVAATLKMLSSFPDRKMNNEAIIWSKAGENHFYSSHRIASTGTNLGATAFGKATGKKISFRTIADCLITENKIIEEWLVRDNLHLVQQLGFDPVEMAKRNQGYRGIKPSFSSDGLPANSMHVQTQDLDVTKPGDLILSLFEHVWKPRHFQHLHKYYHPHAIVHAICDKDLQSPRLINNYLENLFASFPEAEGHLERVTCNEKRDEIEVAARWKIMGKHSGNGFFGPASGNRIIMPGISQYIIKNGKIAEEWMIFDGFDVLCQIHTGSNTDRATNLNTVKNMHLNNKRQVVTFIDEMNKAMVSNTGIHAVLDKYLANDVTLNVTKPFEEIIGIRDYASEFWMPLLHAFPNLENQPYILIGGNYEGRDCVSLTGNLIGTFQNTWLGIPPTQQPTWIRYAAHFILRDNKITHAWYFLDMLDVMRQAGFNFFPNKGVEWVPPAPMTGDGIVTYPTRPKESQKSFDLTLAMIEGLLDYDGKSLDSMGQERFWDVQNMMWYGPSGIGTTKGLKGFQDNHQIPFLKAFPNRGVIDDENAIHMAQLADGNYSCHVGFPLMDGKHTGDGWLGLKASHRTVTMRVMDFWRREGDWLKENWVFIDMIDVLEQLGVNVFELLHEQIRDHPNTKKGK